MSNLINKIIIFKNFIFLLIKSNFLRVSKIKPNHNLHKKLTVSITAKRERFFFLDLVLKSILNQSIHPDEIILWVEYKDKKKIPQKILKMKNYGIKILFCKNFKSYNKIIHTLNIRKENYIITFDDDIFYHKDSIKYLLNKSLNNPKDIIANRIHKIILDKKKLPIEYKKWKWNSTDSKKNKLNFLTGVYGVLYPPHSFYKNITNNKIFMKLSPAADDLWLYWMIRLNKKFIRWSNFDKKNFEIINLNNDSLRARNVENNYNDLQIKNLIDYYGFPK
jgi:protein O-GlcNAc transferase|tara:strand:- start:68 stop:898 length:831 start_codon:yes stop_codon:yes gene_type:complete